MHSGSFNNGEKNICLFFNLREPDKVTARNYHFLESAYVLMNKYLAAFLGLFSLWEVSKLPLSPFREQPILQMGL